MEWSWNHIVQGSPTFKLSEKIKRMNEVLKTRNRDVLGNIHDKAKSLENRLLFFK